jgi:hypothetical protein
MNHKVEQGVIYFSPNTLPLCHFSMKAIMPPSSHRKDHSRTLAWQSGPSNNEAALLNQHVRPPIQYFYYALPGPYPVASRYPLPHTSHFIHGGPINYADSSSHYCSFQSQYHSHCSYHPYNQPGAFSLFNTTGFLQPSIQEPFPPYTQQLHQFYGVAANVIPKLVGVTKNNPKLPVSAITTLRNPARRAEESCCAVWVGNLPRYTSIEGLIAHFFKGRSRDIESIFLLQRSKCAFVNYAFDDACTAAMEEFNQSLFQRVRLVCRLARSYHPSLTTSAVPSSVTSDTLSCLPLQQSPGSGAPMVVSSDKEQLEEKPGEETSLEASKRSDRFFVIKSLTTQDLEQCVRSGLWSAQRHNIDSLNRAYEVSFVALILTRESTKPPYCSLLLMFT